MSSAWAGGSTGQWRKIRAWVLRRDQHQCQLRLDAACEGVATQVHHTVDRRLVGDDPAYLVSACGPCNYRAGDPRKAADPPCVPLTRW